MNKPEHLTPNQDFDWEAYEQGTTALHEDRQADLEKYEATLANVKEKEVVKGRIVDIVPRPPKAAREFIVSIGSKSTGSVAASEFKYNPDFKIGDEVEVYVDNLEDRDGHLVLSHRLARAERAWERISEAAEKDEIIIGYIKSRTKGGMVVDIFGVDAFLPGSQIDVRPIRDYDALLDKTMEFKIVKLSAEQHNVVVSHKVLIEAELEQQKKDIIGKLEKGQVLEGVVKNIMPFGVFVDLGGVDGLIHITDLSWSRINSPEEVVTLDEKINVVILDFDEDKTRISLGLKQLTPNPWDSLDKNLKPGDIVKGKVEMVTDYGAFVEIAPGIEGLIHVSEMSWTQHLRSAFDFIKNGEEVEAVILSIEPEERKMSLGLKQLKPDPWLNIEEKFPVGSRHMARVRNFTHFGVFVELEEGVDGLIHLSDLTWTKRIKHPSEFTEIDAELEVVVLEIDKENRRLSLGHKQTEENPWDVFETVFTEGSVHEGMVESFTDKGAIISLPYGVEGFTTQKHLTKEDGSKLQVDEKAPFKVIEFNKENHRIFVSHLRVYEEAKRDEERKQNEAKVQEDAKLQQQVASQKVEKATLGDLSELAELKDKLDEQ